MNLPDLRYACVHCGYSCEGLQVELSAAEHERLEASHPDSVQARGARHWLRKNPCGSCHFLLPEGEGRCGLHREQGLESKPDPCREFPFRAVQTPGGVFLGASFACRAIAERSGPPVEASMAPQRLMTLPGYPLAPDLPFSWETYARWEQVALAHLMGNGHAGLWSVALELSAEVRGVPALAPSAFLEQGLQAAFRGLQALAEGLNGEAELMSLLTAHARGGTYQSRLVGGPVDVAGVLARWEEPWTLFGEVRPFFEHLLFRKFLLEGPDVHARVCSLPLVAQILQFLSLARSEGTPEVQHVHWALRAVEERLTFHSRGLERYLGQCGRPFLDAPL